MNGNYPWQTSKPPSQAASPSAPIAEPPIPEDSPLAYALQYAALGWQVFPIAPGRKVPLTEHGLKDATTDRAQIIRWYTQWPTAGVGAVMGRESGVFAVDVDPRNGGDDTLADLIDRHGAFPDTVEAITGGGGTHYLFSYPAGEKVRKTRLGAGIDIQSDGSYIVVEPSVHPSGTQYEWEGSSSPLDGVATADAPQWLLDRVLESEAAEPAVEAGHTIMPPERVTEIRSALLVIQADDRDDWLQVGMALHSTGAGDQAFGLWCEWAAQSDKFDLADQRRVWASFSDGHGKVSMDTVFRKAYDAGWVAPRVDTGEFIFDTESLAELDDDAEAAADKVDGLGLFSFGELMDAPLEVPEEFWGEATVFRRARILLAGQPKVGKSNFFLDMAVAAATGSEFLGIKFSRPLRVLWLQAEIHRAFLFKRLQLLTKRLDSNQMGLLRKNLVMSGRMHRDLCNPKHHKELMEASYAVKPDIIGIDPVVNFSTAKENDNAEVFSMLQRADAIAEVCDAALALVHHVNKGGGDTDPFSAIRGAGAFRGWYDTGLMLTANSGATVLNYELRNARSPNPQGVSFNEEQGRWVVDFSDVEGVPQGVQVGRAEPIGGPDARVATLADILRSGGDWIGRAALMAKACKVFAIKERAAAKIVQQLDTYPGITSKTTGHGGAKFYAFGNPDEVSEEAENEADL